MSNLKAQSDFSSNYTISNHNEVNTYYDEMSFCPSTEAIFFVSSARGLKDENDVWKGSGGQMELFMYNQSGFIPFADVNLSFHHGPVSVQNESIFYFTAIDNKTNGNYTSYISKLEVIQHNTVATNVFKTDQYSFRDPSISKDGRFMYFSSDMPGGYGGFDLYMSFREDGKWSAPINLGAGVNTDKDETSPFYHEASGRVFFTSGGHDSFGGTDIFYCFNQGDSWTNAVNIGNSINSSNNETSIYFDDQLQSGYVASDKKSGKGGYDIYKIERKVE
ncbi:MAG: hypothetical protein R2728_09115 [Chitinophagales bacterium]